MKLKYNIHEANSEIETEMWIKVLKDEILSILMTLMTRSDSTSPEASKLNEIFILEKTRGEIHNFKLNVQRSSRLDRGG